MKPLPRRVYEFSSFRVDAAERQLWRDGEIVPVTAKVFDILLVLVEHSGQTLDKDELMRRVWADTFVEEGNLNRNISTLRRVLGDDSHKQQFIKTIPKHGYRFTADVREILEDAGEVLVESKTRYQLKVSEEIREGPRVSFSPHAGILAVAALLLLTFAAAALTWNHSQTNGARSLALTSNTVRAEAFELYLRGRALWQTRNGEDLHEATVLLERAVQKDASFALAHAALADAYAFDVRHWKKAESTAREAIRLDPNLAEPHASIGFVRMFWEWKFDEAEAEFKQAIQLNPDYATAHQWYAISLFAMGNAGSAGLVEMKKASQLEPDSQAINASLCQTLYFLRRYDEAIAQCRKTLAMNADFYDAYRYLYEIYNAKGMYTEAIEAYFKTEELYSRPSPPDIQAKLRTDYGTGGVRRFWEARLEFLLGQNFPKHYLIAQHYARLGKTDEAFSHLQHAYEKHDTDFMMVLTDPVFAEIRADQRYQRLASLLLSSTE